MFHNLTLNTFNNIWEFQEYCLIKFKAIFRQRSIGTTHKYLLQAIDYSLYFTYDKKSETFLVTLFFWYGYNFISDLKIKINLNRK